MQPITYGKKRVFDWRDNVLLFSLGFFVIAVVNILSPPIWELQDEADRAWRGLFVLLISFLTAAGFFCLALPRHNQLQLDKDGLTYKSAGQRGAWPWRDISAFTLARGWRGPCIEFTVSGRHGRRWRNAPLQRTKAGLTGTIPNIWDTPLEDIAAKLNQYRDRALGGANGPASPEQA